MTPQTPDTFNCPACNIFEGPYKGTPVQVFDHLAGNHGWTYIRAWERCMDLIQTRAASQWQIEHATTNSKLCECGTPAIRMIDFDPGDPEVGPQPDIVDVCDDCFAQIKAERD